MSDSYDDSKLEGFSGWEKIHKLEEKGLTRSILEELKTLYNRAKAGGKKDEIIKIIIYQAKYESQIREEAHIEIIRNIENEIKESGEPVASILKSILADFYWQYYKNNRDKFSQRTETAGVENETINTWDLRKLVKETSTLYISSLEERDILKSTKIEEYDLILIQGNSRDLRPTLYDFLAHRALNFFLNEEVYLSAPAYTFELNDQRLFSPPEEFVTLTLKAEDADSLKFRSLLILQDLINFHLTDPGPSAFIAVNLRRLKFVREHAVEMDKDKLYVDALQFFTKRYTGKQVSGIISHKIAEYYHYSTPGSDVPDDARWNRKKACEICESVIKEYPESEGAENCRALIDRIRQKTLRFDVEKAIVQGVPFRILLSYRNIGKVYFRIIKLTEEQRKKGDDAEYNDGIPGIVQYYSSLSPLVQLDFTLPDKGDFSTHLTEVKMPRLDYGYYMILASPRENFGQDNNAVFYSPLWVTDIGFIFFEDWQRKSKRFYVTHRETGVPLEGVRVQVLSKIYDDKKCRYVTKKAKTCKTDKNGYFHIKKHNSRQFLLKFTYKRDVCLFDNQYYQYKPHKYKENPVKTIFFTDRAIYRPGQTIYFKGLVLRDLHKDSDKKKIETNYKTTVYFYDVNNQVIAQVNVTTNEYGTFHGTFTAPADRLNGTMQIATDTGSKYFSVEEYKRPGFEVLFHPLKGSFKLSEKVIVRGLAKAYSGFPVDSAFVKYRILRNASYPYWCSAWGEYPYSGQVEIKYGTMKTDGKGEFTIGFTALPDHQVSPSTLPVFTYTVYADVVDINGETHSNQVSVKVGYVALAVSIDIPDKINKEIPGEYNIQSLNLNNEYEPSKGNIRILQLKVPDKVFRSRLWSRPDTFIMSKSDYYSSFPYDTYDNEHEYYTWEKGHTVFDKKFDTEKEKKLVIESFKNWQQGKYLLELFTEDSFGREIKIVKYFTLYSDKEKELPVPELFWFMPVKTICQPGEMASLEVGTKEENVHVLYEVIHKNEVVAAKYITLNNERKKITFIVEEKHRGNFTININHVRHNRVNVFSLPIQVSWKNKELSIEFETFRGRLLPGENEEWKLKLSGSIGEKIGAEMVAALYDASLDSFAANSFAYDLYPYFSASRYWQTVFSFTCLYSHYCDWDLNCFRPGYNRNYDRFNYYGFSFADLYSPGNKPTGGELYLLDIEPSPKKTLAEEKGTEKTTTDRLSEESREVTIRTNLDETAFFYPDLETDKDGKIIISFTIPESLTRWKMLGFAHTKDVKYGYAEKELVTQKDLMIIPNPPRFFRENDTISFTAKVTNLSGKDLEGEAILELYDAITMQSIDELFLNKQAVVFFKVKKGLSSPLEWTMKVPENLQAVTFRVIARAGNFSDAEESTLPVLKNRMMVAESLTLPVRGKGTKEYQFIKLTESGKSNTLQHHRVTLEFTSNPVWYAVQALPYMMEYPYECSEQVFSRFYANSIAAHIINSLPKIKKVFESWKGTGAFTSGLEKNSELKSLLLKETPWVLQAQDESERKKRVALLFDLNRMKHEMERTMKKIIEMQVPHGGWPWFPGLPEDRYITQHITAGMGHLDRLGIKNSTHDQRLVSMIQKATEYLDTRMKDDYDYLIKNNINLDRNNLGYLQIHYLYTRSFFTDLKMSDSRKKAFEYWMSQAEKYWFDFIPYMQGMISLTLYRSGNKKAARDIVNSLKENAVYSEELGMYWKSNPGYFWYQAQIETQALLIEVFSEIAEDQHAVEEMKIRLLKQKQTENFGTTKATAEACYALLLGGANLLESDEPVRVTLGNLTVDPLQMKNVKVKDHLMKNNNWGSTDVEHGTGYFKASWGPGEITPEMGNISIVKKAEGIAWGALYWQYFEELDKITPQETPLKLKKRLFLQKDTDIGPAIEPITGNTGLKPGDLIKVRIELKVDRDMEYLHMKNMRASGLEPLNVFSGYRYQDDLKYYESTKDASTNFFFPRITKGTYVFEYPLRITHRGDFSNGITTIQCMYAPEYTSHSEGMRIKV